MPTLKRDFDEMISAIGADKLDPVTIKKMETIFAYGAAAGIHAYAQRVGSKMDKVEESVKDGSGDNLERMLEVALTGPIEAFNETLAEIRDMVPEAVKQAHENSGSENGAGDQQSVQGA